MRSRTRTTTHVVAAALATGCLLLAGCAQSGTGSSGSSGAGDSTIVGTWGSTATHKPHLVFGDDDSVKGSDGCNRLVTTYTVSGDTATLKSSISTMMACPGIDLWLSHVRTATIDGDKLVIKNKAGEQIGTLERSSN